MSQPESDRLLKIYDVGETVVIHSLVKAANLNNRQGRLMAFNDKTKRWSVHLLESNEKLKAIKPGNLKPATECTSTFELMKANRAPITATPTMQMKMKMHEGEKEDDDASQISETTETPMEGVMDALKAQFEGGCTPESAEAFRASFQHAMKGGLPGQQLPPQPTPETIREDAGPNPFGFSAVKERLTMLNIKSREHFVQGLANIEEWMTSKPSDFSPNLLRLAKQIYHHGAVSQPRDTEYSSGRGVYHAVRHGNAYECDEIATLISLPLYTIPSLVSLCSAVISQTQCSASALALESESESESESDSGWCSFLFQHQPNNTVSTTSTKNDVREVIVAEQNNATHTTSTTTKNDVREVVAEQNNATQRVIFVIGVSDQNTCDTGCWCTGAVSFELSYYLPDSVNSEHSHGSKDGTTFQPGRLLMFAYPNGGGNGGGWSQNMENVMFRGPNGTERGPKQHEGLPSQFATNEVAVALGIQSSEVGILARLLIVSANVLGMGRTHWQFIENLHNRKAKDNENGVSQYKAVTSVLYEAPSLQPGQSLNKQLRFNGIGYFNPFQPLPPDDENGQERTPKHQSAASSSSSSYYEDEAKPETAIETTVRVVGGNAMHSFPDWNEIRGRTTLRSATTGGGVSPRFLTRTIMERICFDYSSQISSAIGLCNFVVALGDWQQKVLIGANIHEFFASIDRGNPVGTDCADGGEEWSVCKTGFRHQQTMCRNCFRSRTLESIAYLLPGNNIQKLAGMELGSA